MVTLTINIKQQLRHNLLSLSLLCIDAFILLIQRIIMVLSLNRLRTAFNSYDVTDRDYLDYEELFTLLNKLGGTMF